MVGMQDNSKVQTIEEAIEKDRLEIVALQLKVAKDKIEQLSFLREKTRKPSDDRVRATPEKDDPGLRILRY